MTGDEASMISTSTNLPAEGSSLVTKEDGTLPSYITEAAVVISEALVLEAEEKFTESVEAYRSAIGKLLGGVQSDPDLMRQASVKKRVAQYISKAEQLVERELDSKVVASNKHITSTSSAIPHLHLFSNLSDLRQYKVVDILDARVILAEHRETKIKVVFKVLQKSSAVYKKSKTSVLPINIKFMVNLLKYWETDEAVFLMVEYCPAGKLWNLVQPLVHQQLQDDVDNEKTVESVNTDTETHKNINTMKTSHSYTFSSTNKQSTNESSDTEGTTDSDLGDMNVVHSENNSLLVISDHQIHHYSMEEEDLSNEVRSHQQRADKKYKSSQSTTESDRKYNSILEKVCQMELSLKSRLRDTTTTDIASFSDSNTQDLGVEASEASETKTCDNMNNNQTQSHPVTALPHNSATVEQDSVFTYDNTFNSNVSTKEITDKTSTRKLRKLSEMLPQVPDTSLADSTILPDRIIRLWAAELVRALTSLHYRDIIIKDLNPDNVLLDVSGHIRLSYQCEWVSVERSLSQTAVRGRFIAPEVLTPTEVTRAADWWSFGAILLLLYTGQGPCSLIPSGLEGTIPLVFPSYVPPDAVHFVTSLLQVCVERRLGSSSTGHQDIRSHPYFYNLDWDTNIFVDK